MAKFNTNIDSAGLTTLAGLGALAFLTRDKKDKDKPKDEKTAAVKTLSETVTPKPVEPVKAEPVKSEPVQPQDKTGFRGNASGALPNEKRPNKTYPVKQAAQTKAAMKGTFDPYNDIKNMDEGGRQYKSGGKVKSASARADGCAIRGKTRA